MDNEAKSSAVAIALKMWKEGERCLITNCGHPQSKHSDVGWAARVDHAIPPPDLLSPEGADRLMTALMNKHKVTNFHEQPAICIIDENSVLAGYGHNWREALLDATWKLFCEGKNV